MIVTLIAIIIGVIAAIPGTIMPSRHYLKPRHEKTLYSMLLIPIALIYIGFAYYYGNLDAMHAEIIGLVLFVILAFAGQMMSSKIVAVGYLVHGMWDIAHEIFIANIGGVLPWTQVPTGYAVFCLTVDVIIAYYVYQRCAVWDSDERVARYNKIDISKN